MFKRDSPSHANPCGSLNEMRVEFLHKEPIPYLNPNLVKKRLKIGREEHFKKKNQFNV
jgi:hypothetical protein